MLITQTIVLRITGAKIRRFLQFFFTFVAAIFSVLFCKLFPNYHCCGSVCHTCCKKSAGVAFGCDSESTQHEGNEASKRAFEPWTDIRGRKRLRTGAQNVSRALPIPKSDPFVTLFSVFMLATDALTNTIWFALSELARIITNMVISGPTRGPMSFKNDEKKKEEFPSLDKRIYLESNNRIRRQPNSTNNSE